MSDRLNCLYNITQKPHDTTVNYKKLVFNQVSDDQIGEVPISAKKTCFDQYLEQRYMFQAIDDIWMPQQVDYPRELGSEWETMKEMTVMQPSPNIYSNMTQAQQQQAQDVELLGLFGSQAYLACGLKQVFKQLKK